MGYNPAPNPSPDPHPNPNPHPDQVPVYMGYNKNVTPYVRKALEEAKKVRGPVTTWLDP